MIQLNTSRVRFISDPHSYVTEDGKELKGITGILSEHIFTNKYFNVSKEVLDAAAARGSLVHEQCRAYDKLGFAASVEAEAYAKMKEDFGLETVENEYTVSDNEYIASNIDAVHHYKEDALDEVTLSDFKTTSHLDIEYLSWQLSVYKYLFELQNPHLKVVRLLGIWLPMSKYGKPKVEVIPMKPKSEVERLLACDRRGEKFTALPTTIPSEVLLIRERCFDVIMEMNRLKKESEELHAALYKAMEDNDVKKWETEDFTVTRILPRESKRFDSKAFQEEHADLYEQYQTTSKVKGSVKITLKAKKA